MKRRRPEKPHEKMIDAQCSTEKRQETTAKEQSSTENYIERSSSPKLRASLTRSPILQVNYTLK